MTELAKPPTKPYWSTTVSFVEEADVYIRGYSLGDLIGSLSFPAATFLLVRGRLPNPGEARLMDAMLCAILDYSLYKPGTVAARYCASGNPQMVPALATAVLAVGEFTLAPEDAGRFIISTFKEWKESGQSADAYAQDLVAGLKQRKQRVPGLGHPVFKYMDPRAQRLKQIAAEVGVWGEMGDWYEAVHRAFTSAPGRESIPINDVGMLAAIMAEMGFTPAEMTGLAILSSIPGDIAHISEELQQNVRIRIVPDEIAEYPDRTKRDLNADMKAAGWASA
jgi:citryl-CoA lyase